MLIPIVFWIFVVWKYDMIFFRDLAAWRQNIFFMFWRKLGILIPDLYLYSIKIQTNIDQNTIKNTRGNHKFSENSFFYFLGWAGPGPPILGWAGTAQPSKQKQTVENSPLFTCNVNSGAARARKKKKKRSGGLPGGCPFLRELKLPVICCWAVVLFLLCFVFSVFLLLPASVSCFSFNFFFYF